MQNNSRKWQIIFTVLTLIIAIIMYGIFASLHNKPVEQPHISKASATYCENNYNVMKTDTFVTLLDKAYGNLINYKISHGLLEVEMKHANELTKDFFNGNDALLGSKLNDHGFEIQYNSNEQSLKALFKINERNGINVPNDVLIKLIDKITSTSYVNNEK